MNQSPENRFQLYLKLLYSASNLAAAVSPHTLSNQYEDRTLKMEDKDPLFHLLSSQGIQPSSAGSKGVLTVQKHGVQKFFYKFL